MWYTILLILQLLYLPVRSQISCEPIVELKCPNKRYTYHVYQQPIKFKLPCLGSKITDISWSMYTRNGRVPVDIFPGAKKVVTLQASKYNAGNYDLYVTVTESNGAKTKADCKFSYVPEAPVLIFAGGFSRDVQEGTNYTVDLTPSKSFGGKPFPPITWSVRCRYKPPSECSSNRQCTIDGKPKMRYTETADKCILFKTFEASIMYDGIKIVKLTRVNVRLPLYCSVALVCEKNCNAEGSLLSNPDLPIAFRLEKRNNYCSGFDTLVPNWKLVAINGTEIYVGSLEVSGKSKRVIIPAGLLGRATIVAVRVDIPNLYDAWEEIRTIPNIKSPECKITPASGKSMQTKFTVKCTIKDAYLRLHAPVFKVYQIKDDQKILITTSAATEFEMILPSIKGQPKQQLEIEGYDIFQNYFPCNSNRVEVKEIELTKKDINTAGKIIEQAKQLRDPMGIQYVNAVLQELEQSNMDNKTKQGHKIILMDHLTSLEVTSADTYEQVAGVLPLLLAEKDLTEEYKTSLGNYCKQIAATYKKELAKSPYVKYHELNAKKQAESTSKCAEKLLENSDDTELEDPDATTTAKPVLKNMNDSNLTEDYQDYALPYKSPGDAQGKKDAVNINQDTAIAIGDTMNKGQSYGMNTSVSKTQINKDDAQDLQTKRIDIGDVTIVPSKIFKDASDDEIVAIISNYDKDTMMPTSNLSADIIDIHFHKNHTHVKNAEYTLEFKITDELPEFLLYEVKPPMSQEWREIDRTMNVHRLNLMRLETCVIVFRFTEPDIKLDIAMSINERPRARHFEMTFSNMVFDSNKPHTFLIHNPYAKQESDSFLYMAVTPHVDMLEDFNGTLVPYEIQIVAVSCVTYDWAKHHWSPSVSCKTTVAIPKDIPIVKCICRHSSLHSVYYKPVDHRLEEELQLDFELVPFFNYMVFGHVLVILIMYMIALGLSVRRGTQTVGQDKIYFLADNLKNDRFCYLLITKTGSYFDSGTTANIMMQLYGQNGKSKPHVLNYPDPGCRILQRDGTDWLVLANGTHLGHIESILIWTDSIGLYPTWYCESVNVIDLQTEEQYYFEVHTWFSALKKHVHYKKYKRTTMKNRGDTITGSITKYFRMYYDGRHTWNIFKRDDEDLTYLERITLVLCMIYNCYFLNVFLTRPPELRVSDSIGYGRFKFSVKLIRYSLLSSVLNSLIHLPIIFVLRHSARVAKAEAMAIPTKLFPLKMRNFILYSTVIWISICFTYLTTFGFFMPEQLVFIWTAITTISLLISIIVWENVFISVQNIIISKLGITTKMVYRYKAIVAEVEKQREVLFRTFGEVLLRPYFKKHYRLLTPNECFQLREVMTLRFSVASLFKDMCLFLVFITILYVVCIVQHNEEVHRSNVFMHEMLTEGTHSDGEHRLEDINSIPQIYDYIENVIIPLIHPRVWYAQWYSEDAGLMADFCTKVLGIVELRQQRRMQDCTIPPQLINQKLECSNEAPVFDNMVYYRGEDISPAFGILEVYDGSGYIAPLGRNLKNSQFVMSILRRNRWIDINTKVLFIEFLTYNANANIFNAVRIMFERSAAARLVNSVQIFTVSMIYVSLWKEFVSAILLLLLTIVIIIMIAKRLIHIIIYRHSYFKNFWNIIDILLSVLSMILIALFFERRKQAFALLMQIADSDNNKFVSYFHMMNLVRATTIIYGITIGLATIRLWKFLHFGIIFRIMERTIRKAGPQLLGLFIYQVIIYLMMAMFICPLYGSTVENFRTFYTAMISLYLSSINFHEHLHDVPLLVETINLYIVYVLFMLMSLCFLSAYATTLILNLEESKMYYSNNSQIYSIQNYVTDVYRYYKEKYRRHLLGTRLRAGGLTETYDVNVRNFVYPKADVHRYADMVSMNKSKMEEMRFVSMAAIRVRQRFRGYSELSENDFALMAIIVYHLFYLRKDETEMDNHVFYKMRDPMTGVYKFVPDGKLIQMEMVIKKLLEGKIQDIALDQSDVILHENAGSRRLQILQDNVEVMHKIVNHIVIIGPEQYHASKKSFGVAANEEEPPKSN